MADLRLSPTLLCEIGGLAPDTVYAYRRGYRPVPAILWKFLILLRAYRDLRKMKLANIAKIEAKRSRGAASPSRSDASQSVESPSPS